MRPLRPVPAYETVLESGHGAGVTPSATMSGFQSFGATAEEGGATRQSAVAMRPTRQRSAVQVLQAAQL